MFLDTKAIQADHLSHKKRHSEPVIVVCIVPVYMSALEVSVLLFRHEQEYNLELEEKNAL
jgi:hypothetical protein